MSDFKPGELVDITIKGARITKRDSTSRLWFSVDGTQAESFVCPALADTSVTVERVAPPEWPPQPGDLWRDQRGELWFGQRYIAEPDDHADYEGCTSEGWRPVLVPIEGGPYGRSADRPNLINQVAGPLTLVHREGGDR